MQNRIHQEGGNLCLGGEKLQNEKPQNEKPKNAKTTPKHYIELQIPRRG